MFLAVETMEGYPSEAFDNVLKNNIRTAFFDDQFALPELHKTKDNIVSAGSIAGMIGIAQNAPYGGTKCFMHTFTRGVAIEQASKRVRANCVCPGADDTVWAYHQTSDMFMEDVQANDFINSHWQAGNSGRSGKRVFIFSFR